LGKRGEAVITRRRGERVLASSAKKKRVDGPSFCWPRREWLRGEGEGRTRPVKVS